MIYPYHQYISENEIESFDLYYGNKTLTETIGSGSNRTIKKTVFKYNMYTILDRKL